MDATLQGRDRGFHSRGRRGVIGVGVESQRVTEDELHVATQPRGPAPTVDPGHLMDVDLDWHDRRSALDRDQAGPGFERLERAADRELSLRVDQDVEALVESGA